VPYLLLSKTLRITDANDEALKLYPTQSRQPLFFTSLYPKEAYNKLTLWLSSPETQLVVQYCATRNRWHKLTAANHNDNEILILVSDVSDEILSNQRLEEARTQLKAKIEDRHLMLSILNHELRSPITLLQMMCSDFGYEAMGDKGEMVKATVEHTAQIANELSNILSGVEDELHLTKLSVSQHLERITSAITSLTARNDIVLETHIAQPAQETFLLPSKGLYQIILNLVKNAILHSSGSRVIVKIEVLNDDNSQSEFLFSVVDDGIGMTPDVISRLTQPYQRGNSSAPGTGLGLFVARNLIERFGGKLSIESTPGEGSTFSFALSFKKPVDDLSDRHAASEPTRFNGLRVLVVDDDTLVRALVTRMLSTLGCLTEQAANGTDALESVKDNNFDLILTDNIMPGIDGITLIERLRLAGMTLPICLVSADNSNELNNRAIKAGASRVVTKPVNLASLQTWLCSLVPDLRSD